MMTNEEYLSDGGNYCPHCNSSDIEAGHFEVGAGHAWQPITCNECDSTWNDTYSLIGFSEFEKGDND